jgi:hypothetical protein
VEIGIADSGLLNSTDTAHRVSTKGCADIEMTLVVKQFAVNSDLSGVDVALLVVHCTHGIYGRCGYHARVQHWRTHVVQEWRILPIVPHQAG